MLPGVQSHSPPGNCVFPWTLPAQVNAEADQAVADPAGPDAAPAPEQPVDAKPIAYRAWCVEHADELDGG